MDPAQSRHSCTANGSHENSLGLVIASMASDEFVELCKGTPFVRAFQPLWKSGFQGRVQTNKGDRALAPAAHPSHLPEQISEETVPQLPCRSLHADAFPSRMLGDIVAVGQKLQIVLTRQVSDELLIRIRLLATQLVIEMNDRKNNPQLTAQLQQQSQKRN